MKKRFFFAAITLLLIVSCKKDNSTTIPAIDCSTVTQAASTEEVTTLKHYLDSGAISAVQDSRGFFYTIDSAVAGDTTSHASVCSTVAVTYKGTFLNGITFDSSSTVVTFPLSTVIVGWKEMLPLMKKKCFSDIVSAAKPGLWF